MDVVEVDIPPLPSGDILIYNSAEDMTSFSTGNLDGGSDSDLIKRTNCMRLRALHNLHVPHGSQLNCEVGKGIGGAVDDEYL